MIGPVVFDVFRDAIFTLIVVVSPVMLVLPQALTQVQEMTIAFVPKIALKIREVAAKHSVPIVENPPLVRAFHATLEIDQQIPSEHYKAVAEVIGYVIRLRRMVAGRR